MYSDSSPPPARIHDEFPNVNIVVTVDNCWYYLSLLERFVDTTRDMPEDILKLYLVRAEYRYCQWISKRELDRNLSLSIPPVDVAFFWQAHMLSPLRYYEDTIRMPHFQSTHRIPLQEIHDLPKQLFHSPARKEWSRVMNDEPYTLTKEALVNNGSCASVTCIVCFACIESPWEEYTEWRTDHTVALQCHSCLTMFTVKHVGKANLFADNDKKERMTAGLLLDEFANYASFTEGHELLQPIEMTKALPFNRGLKPLDDFMKGNQVYPSTAENTTIRKKITDAIQSTYLCTPYRASSIDLIQAVARQYNFAHKATKIIRWDAPHGIIKGIRNYTSFLALIGDNPKLIAVPTFEIDLAWHTHMLHHTDYCDFTQLYLGRLINHDDNIPEVNLKQHVQKTDKAWKSFSEKRKEAMATLTNELAAASSSEKEEEEGVKSKIKSIFSNKEKRNSKVTTTNSEPYYKKGFVTEQSIFQGDFKPGNYRSFPPHIPADGEETNGRYLDYETGYDKAKVSFHDKREIKELITLKNSNSLMDQEFVDVKNSVYGFIGTSNCANTDFLDQWDTSDDTGGAAESLQSKDGTSKYSKVFLTVKVGEKKPALSSKAEWILPKASMKQYSSFRANENIKYNSTGATENIKNNSTGDAFNWFMINAAWNDAAASRNHHHTGPSCGESNCSNNSPNCDNSGEATSLSCENTTTVTSSCGNTTTTVTPSCGGATSSCGSSCGGGGGSSCGGC